MLWEAFCDPNCTHSLVPMGKRGLMEPLEPRHCNLQSSDHHFIVLADVAAAVGILWSATIRFVVVNLKYHLCNLLRSKNVTLAMRPWNIPWSPRWRFLWDGWFCLWLSVRVSAIVSSSRAWFTSHSDSLSTPSLVEWCLIYYLFVWLGVCPVQGEAQACLSNAAIPPKKGVSDKQPPHFVFSTGFLPSDITAFCSWNL